MVDVAQLVRVPDCGSEGRGFEPHLPPQKQTQGFYLAFFCCMRFPSASSRKLLHQKRAFCALLLFVRGSVVVGCEALEAMKEMINPDSLTVLKECYVEKYLADAKPLDYLQFQRIGYFNVDKDSTADNLVFNRTVTLKDSWAKMNK